MSDARIGPNLLTTHADKLININTAHLFTSLDCAPTRHILTILALALADQLIPAGITNFFTTCLSPDPKISSTYQHCTVIPYTHIFDPIPLISNDSGSASDSESNSESSRPSSPSSAAASDSTAPTEPEPETRRHLVLHAHVVGLTPHTVKLDRAFRSMALTRRRCRLSMRSTRSEAGCLHQLTFGRVWVWREKMRNR